MSGPGQVSQSRWSSWAGRALFECALIVFGIVLGLAVNNWREVAQQQHRLTEVREYFAEEIRANREQLTSEMYAPYHRKLADAWTRLSALPVPNAADRAAAWKNAGTGMHPFHPRDAVWTTFVHGEMLERMQPRELLALAEIYRAQDDLRQVNQALLATVLALTVDSEDSRFIRSQANATSMTLNDITYAEAELLKLYDRALRAK
jgi:hypothetical protein